MNRTKSCWTCKYLILLEITPELTPNYTHYSTKCCPFKSENMISCHPGGEISEIILLDTRDWRAWNDGGLDSKYCKGYTYE